MPRSLDSYGLDQPEFEALLLDDPALFDAILTRMIEDLELSAFTLARQRGRPQIDGEVADEAVRELVGAHLAQVHGPLSPEFREEVHRRVGDLARAPLPYADGGQERLSEAAGTAALNFLQVGANGARGENSRRIKLRHFLPACESWPYPFNRFC